MKNIFATNVTYDENNISDGDFLIVERLSQDEEKKLSELEDNTFNASEASPRVKKSVVILSTFAMILLIISLSLLAAMIESNVDDTDNISLLVAPPFYPGIIIVVSISVLVAVYIYSRKEVKKLKESTMSEKNQKISEAERQLENYIDELKKKHGITEDSREIETVSYSYKIKDGVEEVEKFSIPMIFKKLVFTYFNIPRYFFIEGEAFYIADEYMKMEIPRRSLKYACMNDGNMDLSGFYGDKDVPPGKYDSPHVKRLKNGHLSIDRYISVVFEINGEEYCIYFPPYEQDHVKELFGVQLDRGS